MKKFVVTCGHAALEQRQIADDGIPNGLGIYFGIFVNEKVSHRRGWMPFHLGMNGTNFLRNTLDRFSDHFQISHDGILSFAVMHE